MELRFGYGKGEEGEGKNMIHVTMENYSKVMGEKKKEDPAMKRNWGGYIAILVLCPQST